MSDAVQEPSAVQLQEEANRELRQQINALQAENEAADLAANEGIRLAELRNERDNLNTEFEYQQRLRAARLGTTEEVVDTNADAEAAKAAEAAAVAVEEAAALAAADAAAKATPPTPLFPAPVGVDQLESKIGKDK